MTGKDVHRLPILCDGAAGDFDALSIEEFGQFVIAQWLVLRLGLDQVSDGVFHACIAEVFTTLRLHAVREKETELKNTVRRCHVFSRDGPANGGLMHTDFLSHLRHV